MTMWNPTDQLATVVRAALDDRAITYETHGGPGCTYLVLPVPRGGEIAISDIDSDLPGTLAEYTGLRGYYFPTSHALGLSDEVPLFESPDLGERRSPDRFAAEFPALLAAVTACLALFGSGESATRRLTAEAAERFTLRPPAPASHRYYRTANGTVALTITTSTVMDAKAIASKLYAAYSKPYEGGTALPAVLTIDDIMQVLADEAAGCAHDWHFWQAEPGQDAWDDVHPWARHQVERLFPALTWPAQD
ncbi:hypothetical protein ACFVXQ_26385 [Kitasatospora sp. NPDC058263]